MPIEHAVGRSRIRLIRDDITKLDIDAFVFYARPDLALGSGFGTAIAVRGGPAIQQQLREIGHLEVGRSAVTTGGKLAARHIVHAVGPRFQEEHTEEKLHATVVGALEAADAQGIRRIAFPAMGAGFYGVPLGVSARVSLSAVKSYVERGTSIEEVVFCLLDSREFRAHEAALGVLAGEDAASAPANVTRGAA